MRGARQRPALPGRDPLHALLDGREMGRGRRRLALHDLPATSRPGRRSTSCSPDEVEKVNASLPRAQRIRRFRLALQGAGRRRRRAHPDPQAAARRDRRALPEPHRRALCRARAGRGRDRGHVRGRPQGPDHRRDRDPRRRRPRRCRSSRRPSRRAPMAALIEPTARAGRARQLDRVLLAVERHLAALRRRAALTDVSFDIRKGEIRAIIGPNGAGKSSMLNVINGFYQPQEGTITWKGRTLPAHAPPRGGGQGIAPHLPEHRPVQGHEHARQHHGRPDPQDARQLPRAGDPSRAAPGARNWRIARSSSRSSTSSRSRRSATCRSASCPTACRSGSSSAGRWRCRARAPAARRADGRHEPRGEGGHVPLHPRRQRGVRHDDRPDRARHGRGHGHLATGSSCSTTASCSPTARPDEVRNDPAVIDAYLGVAHDEALTRPRPRIDDPEELDRLVEQIVDGRSGRDLSVRHRAPEATPTKTATTT